jgi:hypothetical protein
MSGAIARAVVDCPDGIGAPPPETIAALVVRALRRCMTMKGFKSHRSALALSMVTLVLGEITFTVPSLHSNRLAICLQMDLRFRAPASSFVPLSAFSSLSSKRSKGMTYQPRTKTFQTFPAVRGIWVSDPFFEALGIA